jgi:hypothetical protein
VTWHLGLAILSHYVNFNLTEVQKSKAVLFGGATRGDGRFLINSDTYVFTESKKWVKLERMN